ncbi:MAG TPA: mechanosensitive ion channel [Thermoleophilaceae bacterium]|nr:mechanosensitive ion channel [Thermoleophilaceae bacterium]
MKISDSLQQGLDSLFGFIPNLIGFLVILIVGYFVARIVKTVVSKLLDKVGLDRHLHSGQTGQYVEKVSPGASPSKLIGSVVFWFIFLFVLSAAIGALQIPAVTAFMNQVLAYLPNVIVAVLIFVIAGVVAAAVAGLVAKTMGDTPTGKVVASVVPALVMGIAIFMILNQLKIAPEIVQITYTALIGALALGLALAFGLGGREVAAEMLRGAYQKGQEQKGQVKQDMQKGRERARDQAGSALPDGNTGARPVTG